MAKAKLLLNQIPPALSYPSSPFLSSTYIYVYTE